MYKIYNKNTLGTYTMIPQLQKHTDKLHFNKLTPCNKPTYSHTLLHNT